MFRKQGQKGFTLIEMMVVVGIMAVLAAIVTGGVTGTKTAGEGSQAQSDAQTVQQSTSSYNNQTRTQGFPEGTITVSGTGTTRVYTIGNVVSGGNTALSVGLVGNVGFTDGTDGKVTNYTYVKWDASDDVRQKGGTVATAKFVPDFLGQKPDTTRLINKDLNPEYLWLFKKGTTFDEQGRSIEVWKLADDGASYSKIYPKVTN